MNEAELEDWHDYQVASRREIVALLRQIGEKNQLIRMLIKGEADVCVTSILAVDEDSNTVVLDRSIERAQNQRIEAAGRVMCETTLDKIRILFASDNVTETDFENRPALQIAVPDTLVRLQRREFYRMATPLNNPVRACVPLPQELGGGSTFFPLADISCGGIALLDNKFILGNTIGVNYPGCRIDLPDIGSVTTTLQVRNSLDLTLLNNKTNRRLGCLFIVIRGASLGLVQRYITQLERERNARIAGLG